MTKFRISDHELNIERGRQKATRGEERHCQTCKTKPVESEEHLLLECYKLFSGVKLSTRWFCFLLECNLHSNYRNALLNIVNKCDLKFRFFSDREKIRYLCVSNENKIITALAQFLQEALLERYIFTSFKQGGHL